MTTEEFKTIIDNYGRNNINTNNILTIHRSGIIISSNEKSVLGPWEHSLHELLHPFSKNYNENEVQHAVDFINHATKMMQKSILQAEILGRLRFKNQETYVPAHDSALCELLEGLQIGQGLSILEAYKEGYDDAMKLAAHDQ